MRLSTFIAGVLPLAGPAAAKVCKSYVTSDEIQKLITIDNLLAGSRKLQDLADANGGNRAFGSKGHNDTVDYLYDSLSALDYYNVYKQPFTETFFDGQANVTVNGQPLNGAVMTYSASGSVSGSLVNVTNYGCNLADYPAAVVGNVAFISRGNCSFQLKAQTARLANAGAAIVYNNVAENITGTLGGAGNYVPILGILTVDGQRILKLLEAGPVTASVSITAVTEPRVSFNIIAETRGGDHNNVLMLGGHTDSVYAGPGINDDGSGTIGLLRVAEALSKFRVKNAVRFAFWSAEEFGKLGSIYYMKQLNKTDTVEVAKIRAYLNFDMIASPNYFLGIFDGDGSSFNLTGPPGSAQIERDFQDFYKSKGSAFLPAAFTGRSDYQPFIENGIPSGGLFTGHEGIKTEFEVTLFGGTAGVPYDPNYHKSGDTFDNLNHDAYLLNAKAIANSVAKYAISMDSIPAVRPSQRRYSADMAQLFSRETVHLHHDGHTGPCGQTPLSE